MTVDYMKFDGPDLLEACGDDAHKWAEAFCQFVKKLDNVDIDHDWMVTWFANAIEHSSHLRNRQRAVA